MKRGISLLAISLLLTACGAPSTVAPQGSTSSERSVLQVDASDGAPADAEGHGIVGFNGWPPFFDMARAPEEPEPTEPTTAPEPSPSPSPAASPSPSAVPTASPSPVDTVVSPSPVATASPEASPSPVATASPVAEVPASPAPETTAPPTTPDTGTDTATVPEGTTDIPADPSAI